MLLHRFYQHRLSLTHCPSWKPSAGGSSDLANSRAILPYKVLGGFPHQLLMPHQCFAGLLPFLVTVRYGRATRQNRVTYEAFATVLLWCWASHSYLFRGVLRFLPGDECFFALILLNDIKIPERTCGRDHLCG